jgi:tetratricopeptide (TPR) repeat protein
VAVLALISAGVLAGRRKHPYLLVGWLWYLVMLLPVIGIIQVGAQARADRYTYLPQMGLYLLLTWLVADLSVGWPHRRMVLRSLSALVLVSLFFRAHTQASYWRDSQSLWTYACTPDNFFAQYNLGAALNDKGSVDEAIAHYQKALQIKPDFAAAHINLGDILLQKSNLAEAMTHFQRALQLKPDSAEAQNDMAWVLAASPQASLRNGTRALELAQRANQLTLDGNPAVLSTLAAAYAEVGRFPDARETAQRALHLAEVTSNTALANDIRSQMKGYEIGVPFRFK